MTPSEHAPGMRGTEFARKGDGVSGHGHVDTYPRRATHAERIA
jgi:hypothetical protein